MISYGGVLVKALLFVLFLLSSVSQAFAAGKDIRGSKDHELVSRYPSSIISDYEFRDYEAVTFPVGPVEGRRKDYTISDAIDLEGRLTRITYKVSEKTSSLKVYRNYEQALKTSGFEELFSCSGNACGSQGSWGYALGQLGLLNGKQKTIRYLAAKKAVGDEAVYVGLYVMEKSGQKVVTGLNVVETKAMETGLVTVDLSSLQQQLAQDGKVAIYGIHFDVDKADIKKDSAEVLETIQQLLKADTQLKLYVVGHTDDTGSQVHNLDLSSRRAKAVVTALIKQYGIDDERLIPFGAGPYTPVASNRNETGRAKNRRVELVQRTK